MDTAGYHQQACVTGCSPPPTPAAPCSAACSPPQPTRTPVSPPPLSRRTSRPPSSSARPSTLPGPRSRPRRRPHPPSWTTPATSTATRARSSRPCSTTRRTTARTHRTPPALRRHARSGRHRPSPPAPDIRQRREPPRRQIRSASRTRPVTPPPEPSLAPPHDSPLPAGSTSQARKALTSAPARNKTSQPPLHYARPRPGRPERASKILRPPPDPRTPALLTMSPHHRGHRPPTATSRSPCITCPAMN